MAVIQRFGGALNLNVHVDALVVDGVFASDAAGVVADGRGRGRRARRHRRWLIGWTADHPGSEQRQQRHDYDRGSQRRGP